MPDLFGAPRQGAETRDANRDRARMVLDALPAARVAAEVCGLALLDDGRPHGPARLECPVPACRAGALEASREGPHARCSCGRWAGDSITLVRFVKGCGFAGACALIEAAARDGAHEAASGPDLFGG